MATNVHPDFAHPWCQDILNARDIIDVTDPKRGPPPPNNEVSSNNLFSETWCTDSTIRAWKTLRRSLTVEPNLSPEYFFLASLGSGLDSARNMLHGGVTATIFDHCIIVTAWSTFGPTVTKELNVRYKKSVPVPTCVLCRCVITEKQGRRLTVRAVLEDEKGMAYSEANALCVIADITSPKTTRL